MMHRIKTYNQIAQKGLERFPGTRFQVGPDTYEADAILLRSHKLSPNDLCSRLKAVARAGAGVNNIPVEKCTERGIVVFNTPGANANAVKELVLSGMLLASRGILPGIRYVNSLRDVADENELAQLLESGKKSFAGTEL